MKRYTLIKVALVSGMGVLSWYVASSMIAQARTSGIAITSTKTRAQSGRTAPIPAGASVPVVPVAEGSFDEMTVKAGHGCVGVDAQVTLMDKRPGKRYLWSLIVLDQGLNLVSATHYENQIFSLTPGVTVKPTFKEAFPLPPGRYQVDLRLYDLSPGVDPSALDRAGGVGPYVLLSRSERVTVTQ
ncbi:MAG: hypothetical protein ACP5XB_09415 [Isosphaeraceae bacterium]